MSDDRTSSFVDALHTLERDGELDPIVALFAEDADVGNVVTANRFHGQDGARRFWEEYRGRFGELESSFSAILAADEHSALEWRSTGTSSDGSPLDYEGVSIIEWSGDRISRFSAYFDPTKLGLHPSAAARTT